MTESAQVPSQVALVVTFTGTAVRICTKISRGYTRTIIAEPACCSAAFMDYDNFYFVSCRNLLDLEAVDSKCAVQKQLAISFNVIIWYGQDKWANYIHIYICMFPTDSDIQYQPRRHCRLQWIYFARSTTSDFYDEFSRQGKPLNKTFLSQCLCRPYRQKRDVMLAVAERDLPRAKALA